MTHAPQDPGANVTTQLADPVSGTGRAVVVGGGISGLVATRELLRAGWSVTLMEASGHLGGCVSTQHLTPWEVLEAHVRQVVEAGRAAPGHVVNLGHGVPPETDATVLTRVVELIHSIQP